MATREASSSISAPRILSAAGPNCVFTSLIWIFTRQIRLRVVYGATHFETVCAQQATVAGTDFTDLGGSCVKDMLGEDTSDEGYLSLRPEGVISRCRNLWRGRECLAVHRLLKVRREHRHVRGTWRRRKVSSKQRKRTEQGGRSLSGDVREGERMKRAPRERWVWQRGKRGRGTERPRARAKRS